MAACCCSLVASCRRVDLRGSVRYSLHGKLGHPVRLSWGQDATKPRFVVTCWCSLAASCRRVDLRGSVQYSLLTSNFKPSVDEVGGAAAHERALDASEAWRAKRSVRAVSGGHEGRRERPASGQRHTRPATLPKSSDHDSRNRLQQSLKQCRADSHHCAALEDGCFKVAAHPH